MYVASESNPLVRTHFGAPEVRDIFQYLCFPFPISLLFVCGFLLVSFAHFLLVFCCLPLICLFRQAVACLWGFNQSSWFLLEDPLVTLAWLL